MNTVNIHDLGLIVPELILVSMALVLILVSSRIRQSAPVTIATLMTAMAAVLAAVLLTPESSQVGFVGMIQVDGYSQFFKVLIASTLGLSVMLSVRRVDDQHIRPAEYHALLLLAATGMMFAVGAVDLLTLYLGLELTTLCSYVLVGITVDKPRANEAAIKYFLLGSFASGLFLYGIALTYGATGSTNFQHISAQLAISGLAGDPMLLVAAVLMIAGLAFKISAVPFHAWAPDAYEGAHAPVAAFLATASKVAGLAALGRVSLSIFGSEAELLGILLTGLAVLSILVGTITAMAQTNMKRLLAYSSIAHAGYALLGYISGTSAGVEATMTYAYLYVFKTLGAFGVVIALEERGEKLDDYRGLAVRSPLTAALMLLFLLSLTGIPPTAGFVAKFTVILDVARGGHWVVAVLAVACSVISAFVYLRVAVKMYMQEPVDAEGSQADPQVPLAIAAALSVAALVTLAGGILPAILTSWAEAP